MDDHEGDDASRSDEYDGTRDGVADGAGGGAIAGKGCGCPGPEPGVARGPLAPTLARPDARARRYDAANAEKRRAREKGARLGTARDAQPAPRPTGLKEKEEGEAREGGEGVRNQNAGRSRGERRRARGGRGRGGRGGRGRGGRGRGGRGGRGKRGRGKGGGSRKKRGLSSLLPPSSLSPVLPVVAPQGARGRGEPRGRLGEWRAGGGREAPSNRPAHRDPAQLLPHPFTRALMRMGSRVLRGKDATRRDPDRRGRRDGGLADPRPHPRLSSVQRQSCSRPRHLASAHHFGPRLAPHPGLTPPRPHASLLHRALQSRPLVCICAAPRRVASAMGSQSPLPRPGAASPRDAAQTQDQAKAWGKRTSQRRGAVWPGRAPPRGISAPRHAERSVGQGRAEREGGARTQRARRRNESGAAPPSPLNGQNRTHTRSSADRPANRAPRAEVGTRAGAPSRLFPHPRRRGWADVPRRRRRALAEEGGVAHEGRRGVAVNHAATRTRSPDALGADTAQCAAKAVHPVSAVPNGGAPGQARGCGRVEGHPADIVPFPHGRPVNARYRPRAGGGPARSPVRTLPVNSHAARASC